MVWQQQGSVWLKVMASISGTYTLLASNAVQRDNLTPEEQAMTPAVLMSRSQISHNLSGSLSRAAWHSAADINRLQAKHNQKHSLVELYVCIRYLAHACSSTSLQVGAASHKAHQIAR